MKRKTFLLYPFLLIFALLLTSAPLSAFAEETGDTEEQAASEETEAAEAICVETTIPSLESIDSVFGNVTLAVTAGELSDKGFEYADMATVKFLDQEMTIPVVPDFHFLASLKPGLAMDQENGSVELCSFNDDFAFEYGLTDYVLTDDEGDGYRKPSKGVEFPVAVTIELAEKGGYADEYGYYNLEYKNGREDYPDLSDDEFANFRMIGTTGIGERKLYRSSSPINPSIGRSVYADMAIERVGVKSIVNLTDTEEKALSYEGYEDTYYSGQNHIFLNMVPDFSVEQDHEGIVKAMKFIEEEPLPILLHCTEGKDRAGFMSALLECLMGASLEEVRQDYMVTFYNYYGVEPGTDQYEHIARNIDSSLGSEFGVTSLEGLDLQQEAEEYLEKLGVAEETIAAVKEKLA